jgi:hypothetical protein
LEVFIIATIGVQRKEENSALLLFKISPGQFWELFPVIRDNVYHPQFDVSFSLCWFCS